MYFLNHSLTKQFYLFIITLLAYGSLQAQISSSGVTTSIQSDSIQMNGNTSQISEILPEFPGGLEKLTTFLKANLHYPKAARKARVAGKVICSFIIDAEGWVQEVSLVKGIGYGCDEEAIRVLKLMPQWKPGLQNNRKVPVKCAFPITFENRS